MRRRDFIAALGGAAALPFAACAQPQMPVIGFLDSRSPDEAELVIVAFRNGLKEEGYVEGQNVAVAHVWAEGRYDRLPAMASDMVSRRIALIVAAGPPSGPAAKAATSTIPIVSSPASPARAAI